MCSGEFKEGSTETKRVRNYSAQLYIPGEERVGVQACHREMVKFASNTDSTYRTVVRYLKECMEKLEQPSGEFLCLRRCAAVQEIVLIP
jgi:hypothetical protein